MMYTDELDTVPFLGAVLAFNLLTMYLIVSSLWRNGEPKWFEDTYRRLYNAGMPV